MKPSYWGIDVGSNSIKAVQMRKAGDGLEIIDSVIIPVDKKTAQDVSPEAALSQALVRLMQEKEIRKNDYIATAISGHAIVVFNKFLKLPPVDAGKIPEIVKFEARQQIPFPIDEVIWDYYVFEDSMQGAEEIDVALFAVRRSSIQPILDIFYSIGVNPDIIQTSPNALLNYASADLDISTKSVILLESGAKVTDLMIIDKGKFFPRFLPVTGDNITKALQQKFQMPYDEAENLKKNLSESDQSKKIFKVLESPLKDLVGEIQRSIGYYRSQTQKANFDEIYICGSGFRIPTIDSYLKDNIGVPVKKLEKPSRIEIAPEADADTITAQYQSLVVSIGLCAQLIETVKININLLPREKIVEKVLNKKKPYAVVACLLLVVMIVLSWMANSRIETSCDQAIQAKAEVDSLIRSSKSMLENARKETARKEGYLQFLTTIGKSKFRLRKLYKVITASLEAEPNVWLDSIKINPLNENASDADVRKTVALSGRAQHLDGNGFEYIRSFEKALSKDKEEPDSIIRNLDIKRMEMKKTKVTVVEKPEPQFKKDQIDPKDKIGLERHDRLMAIIDSIKDIKKRYYHFLINVEVDLSGGKNKAKKTNPEAPEIPGAPDLERAPEPRPDSGDVIPM